MAQPTYTVTLTLDQMDTVLTALDENVAVRVAVNGAADPQCKLAAKLALDLGDLAGIATPSAAAFAQVVGQ